MNPILTVIVVWESISFFKNFFNSDHSFDKSTRHVLTGLVPGPLRIPYSWSLVYFYNKEDYRTGRYS